MSEPEPEMDVDTSMTSNYPGQRSLSSFFTKPMSEPEPEMDVDTSMKSNSPSQRSLSSFFTKPMTKPEPEMGVATSMNVANELQDNAVDILYRHLPKGEFNEVMKKLPRCRICGGFVPQIIVHMMILQMMNITKREIKKTKCGDPKVAVKPHLHLKPKNFKFIKNQENTKIHTKKTRKGQKVIVLNIF